MAFLFMQPSIIVPILLGVLILVVFIGIIALVVRKRRIERRNMVRNIRKMKELQAAVARISVPDLSIRANKEDYERKKISDDLDMLIEKAKKKESPAKKSGDKTIYDDRKNLSAWQVHLSKTYREMKKKNPNAKFSAAMKAAKKTYKKK
jgi:hypothetical protein